MFPLIQTSAAIIGAGFLFVTGVVVTDNLLTTEEVPILEPAPSLEVTADPTELIAETEATSTATSTEPVEDLATSTEAMPEPELTPSAVVPEPTVPVEAVAPEPIPAEDLAQPELSTTTETIATTSVTGEVVDTIDEMLEIDEAKDCFDGSIRQMFMNPGMCLRELRMRI